MTPFIEQALAGRELGLALHYPLIHAAVVGLGARRTFEFGAGGSTRVFLDAVQMGVHLSISTESLKEIQERYGIGLKNAAWIHSCGKSEDFRQPPPGPLDLILHDGSHAADVVAVDIAWAWPHLKRFGLLLVHDSQHSYCGAEVREGIRRGLEPVRGQYSATTLPYGFGLTIIRREEGGPGEVSPAPAKQTSPHTTQPTTEFVIHG